MIEEVFGEPMGERHAGAAEPGDDGGVVVRVIGEVRELVGAGCVDAVPAFAGREVWGDEEGLEVVEDDKIIHENEKPTDTSYTPLFLITNKTLHIFHKNST